MDIIEKIITKLMDDLDDRSGYDLVDDEEILKEWRQKWHDIIAKILKENKWKKLLDAFSARVKAAETHQWDIYRIAGIQIEKLSTELGWDEYQGYRDILDAIDLMHQIFGDGQ